MNNKEMMNNFKGMLQDFSGNFKFYIDYILKLDFGELLFRFFELLIVIFIALIINVPLALIKDFVYTLLALLGNSSTYLVMVMEVVFSLASVCVSAVAFVYCFNKRYENLQNDIKIKEEEKKKEAQKKAKAEMDMPKSKEE